MRRVVLALCLMTAAPAAAETYAVSLHGITIGQLVVTGHWGKSYKMSARFHTTGVAGALKHIRFDMTASGVLTQNRPAPSYYSEQVRTNSRQSSVQLRYKDSVPAITGQPPAAQHAGSLDPMTALALALGANGLPCPTRLGIFDGTRKTRLQLNGACIGHFQRISGYSARQMARHASFPIQLRFDTAGRLQSAHVQSVHGPVTVTPRN